MTKVTTREFLNGECISETVQTFIDNELVQEVTTEFEITPQLKKKRLSPESIKRMLANRAANKAKKAQVDQAWSAHETGILK